MIVTISGIPVYNAVLSDEETGMMRISLVDDPAVMSMFQAFDSTRKPQMYSVMDEEKRLVRGVVMRADFPIYRYDDSLGEYYIIYKAETIRQMAEKYLAENRQNLVNLMHEDGSDVEGVQMVQYFIKGDGVSVEGFDEIADGSLFAEFHVTNDEVWNAIKEGTYKGFSLEGVFDLEPETDKDDVESIVNSLHGAFKKLSNILSMSKIAKFKAALARILAEFGNVTTDKGILAWDGDEDLKEGDAVHIEDAEGNSAPAEDGDYTTQDGKVIVVVDGKVAEIKDAKAEVAPEEAPAEEPEEVAAEEELPAEEPEAEDDNDARIAELEALVAEKEARIAELESENEALRAENEALKGNVEEMKKMSAAKPAHEEARENKFQKTGIKGIDRLSSIMSAE